MVAQMVCRLGGYAYGNMKIDFREIASCARRLVVHDVYCCLPQHNDIATRTPAVRHFVACVMAVRTNSTNLISMQCEMLLLLLLLVSTVTHRSKSIASGAIMRWLWAEQTHQQVCRHAIAHESVYSI